MLRILGNVTRGILINVTKGNSVLPQICKSPIETVAHNKYFSLLTQTSLNNNNPKINTLSQVIQNTNVLSSLQQVFNTPVRTVTKFSARKGKRKTVKTVIKRFYRLNWGMWIRRYCAHDKHMWKKKKGRKNRLRQYVFTNASQSWLLDTMVTKYWRRPTYYVDDPYNPYHHREEFPYTRKTPLP